MKQYLVLIPIVRAVGIVQAGRVVSCRDAMLAAELIESGHIREQLDDSAEKPQPRKGRK